MLIRLPVTLRGIKWKILFIHSFTHSPLTHSPSPPPPLTTFYQRSIQCKGFPGDEVIESACQCRRHVFNPWVGRSPGVGHGNPFQYFSLDSPRRVGHDWAAEHAHNTFCARHYASCLGCQELTKYGTWLQGVQLRFSRLKRKLEATLGTSIFVTLQVQLSPHHHHWHCSSLGS